MTLFLSRFSDVMVTVHPALDRNAHLVFAWTWNGDGWDQGAPVEVASLAAARALRPFDATSIPVPPDFAVDAWTYSGGAS